MFKEIIFKKISGVNFKKFFEKDDIVLTDVSFINYHFLFNWVLGPLAFNLKTKSSWLRDDTIVLIRLIINTLSLLIISLLLKYVGDLLIINLDDFKIKFNHIITLLTMFVYTLAFLFDGVVLFFVYVYSLKMMDIFIEFFGLGWDKADVDVSEKSKENIKSGEEEDINKNKILTKLVMGSVVPKFTEFIENIIFIKKSLNFYSNFLKFKVTLVSVLHYNLNIIKTLYNIVFYERLGSNHRKRLKKYIHIFLNKPKKRKIANEMYLQSYTRWNIINIQTSHRLNNIIGSSYILKTSILKNIFVFLASYVLILNVYYNLVVFNNKVYFFYIAVYALYYFLFSGFIFFLKKYRFSKFTSSSQRFWKRSYVIFWLLEFFLFSIFIYFIFNSSSESSYGSDYQKVIKERVLSWRIFVIKSVSLTICMSILYSLQIVLKRNYKRNINIYLVFCTFILFVNFWIEFYQAFYILNFFDTLVWLFNSDDNSWDLDSTHNRLRIELFYFLITLFIKFLHLFFIYKCWYILIKKYVESKELSIILLSLNMNNIAIMILLNFIYVILWAKLFLSNFKNTTYAFFLIDTPKLDVDTINSHMKSYFLSILELLVSIWSTLF